VGTSYSQTLAGSGGAGTYVWTETGALPTGLSLSSAGVISGTPTAAGAFPFTATMTDVNGQSNDELVLNHHGGTGNDHDHAQAQVPRDRGSRIRGTGSNRDTRHHWRWFLREATRHE